MAPLAVVCSKLASSKASPASAMAKRMASALYSLIACSSVLKLPAAYLRSAAMHSTLLCCLCIRSLHLLQPQSIPATLCNL